MTRRHLALLGLLSLMLLAFVLIPPPLSPPFDRGDGGGAAKLRAVSFGICPQRPSHSYFLGGRQLPLEARMTGIFGGFFLTLAYLALLGRGRADQLPPAPWIVVLTAFLPLMAADGLNNLAHDLGAPHLYAPDNRLRLATGTLTGITFAAVLLPIFNFTFWKPNSGGLRELRITNCELRTGCRFLPFTPRPSRFSDRCASLAHGGELVGALVVGGTFFAAVTSGPGWLFYPIGLISTAGLIVLIMMANSVVLLATTGREGTGESFWQFLPVGVLALVLTTGELGLMALFRWLTIGPQPLP